MATGFLRNSMINEEGGIDPEQFRMEAMFDRMDAIGKSILGLTIQCAQCHNHKFDPLTQEEYYRHVRLLEQRRTRRTVAVYTPDEQMQRAPICCGEIARDRSRAASTSSPTGRHAWPPGKRAFATTSRSGSSCEPEASTPAAANSYLLLDDGSLLAAGLRADQASTSQLTVAHRRHEASRPFGWNC